jgi:dTMP kinase
MLTLSWDLPVLPGFIVFEGLDGAGTTTQARRLADHLSKTGTPAEFTCEPTDFLTGRTIRRLLEGPEHVEAWTLALLFAADRYEHLERPETGIRARLAAGKTVVSDRYLFSSIAYQGSFVDSAAVERINGAFPLPEYLVFVDTPRSEATRRMATRKNRDILEQDAVQERVAARYRGVVEAFAERTAVKVVSVDGGAAPDAVFAADRYEHLERPETGILAQLAAGKIVVSDRYLFSSIAYQGSFVDSAAVERINGTFPLPEYLVFVDTPRSEATRRMATRETRDILEQDAVQERVAARYRGVVEAFAERTAVKVVSVDGGAAPEVVFAAILAGLGNPG